MTNSVMLRAGLAVLVVSMQSMVGCDNGEGALTGLQEIDSPAPSDSGEPNLTVGADGQVYLSWIESASEGGHALRFAVLDGDAWSEPRTIATGSDWFVNWADFPSLAALPGGRLAAHWLQKSGEGTYAYDVRVALSDDGGQTWSDPVTPHRDGTQTEHGFVSMWAAEGDSVAMVWLDGRAFTESGHSAANEMNLMHTRIGSDGGLAPEHVLDERICDCCQTSAAITANGPLIVYRDRSQAEVRDISVVRYVDGAWTESAPVHHDGWVISGCPVNGPYVSADGQQVAVAWFTAADDTPRVNVSFSEDAGATFGAAVRIDGGAPIGRVATQVLGDGSALVSWVEQSGNGGALVQVRRVSPNGDLGRVQTITESTAARSSGFPRMVVTSDRAVFAWTAAGDPAQVRTATARIGEP